MLTAIALLALQGAGPSIAELDRLASARDVDSLTRYLVAFPEGRSPFKPVGTNGAYDVGRFGWHAVSLSGPGTAQYVVFTTPLTSEDIGALVFRRVGDKLAYLPETERFGIKLIRHDFDIKFDLPTKRANLIDRLSLKSEGSEGGTFLFRMSPQYVVSSITNGAGRPVPFAEAGGVVLTARPNGADRYTINYSAKVDLPNYAGSIGPNEATLTNDYWYPMVARQPTPYDLTVHAPSGWLVVGQGNEVSDTPESTGHAVRYRMDLPCVFYSLSAGRFRKVSQEIHGRTYSCWSAQMTPDQMEAQTEFYAPIIEFYNRTFGEYPFKGYGAVDSAVYGGGALEAYSFTTWGHGALPSEDAHEPSHTWWGGIIDNTYLHSFWNESFAVFSEGLYHRGASIGNTDERALAFIRDGSGSDAYDSIPILNSGAEVGGIGSSLGYGKGSQVLQMLEVLIGHDRMVQTLKAWIEKSRGTDTDWPDYVKVAESICPDKHLESFFEDWLAKPGFADLDVSDVTYSEGAVRMNVGFKGPSFRIPLEVMLEYPSGTRKFTMIDLAKPGRVEIPSDQKPALVSVDPWRRLLRRIEANESPTELNSVIASLPRYTDARHEDYLSSMGARDNRIGAPSDPVGKFLVGNPETMPVMRALCDKVGFKVEGNKLTYDGTTIDLNHGCAMAVVDLGAGRQCAIGLGKTRVGPDVGRARLALTDDLGRFLRGKTDPKTSGYLTFRL